MDAKEETWRKKENQRITLIVIIFIITWSCLLVICFHFLSKKKVYALSDTMIGDIQISNAEMINLDKLIQENTKQTTRTEISIEEEELEYITKYRNNNDLLQGTTKVSQEGRNGKQQIITKKTYNENGELINEERVSATVVKSSINKVVDIGTATKKELAARKSGISGKNAYLKFDMDLTKPSGFSLEQFKIALTDSKDKNKIFENNAEYFCYIEDEYNINGMFVAAVGIHESAWGTSKIALNKKNLFGYGAYDSNPYNGAYKFESYSESIDLIARVFVKYYLNSPGKNIYDNEIASGKYYSGKTLSDINKKYATDKNWAKGVFSHMEYLYSKL